MPKKTTAPRERTEIEGNVPRAPNRSGERGADGQAVATSCKSTSRVRYKIVTARKNRPSPGLVVPGTGAPTGDVDPAVSLLDEWLTDESGYEKETWPKLKEALDRDRLSNRPLFPE
jgi:hypothetical protein